MIYIYIYIYARTEINIHFATLSPEYLANPLKIRILGVIRSSLATRKLHQLFEQARARPQIARSSYYPADGARIIAEGRRWRGASEQKREREREADRANERRREEDTNRRQGEKEGLEGCLTLGINH